MSEKDNSSAAGAAPLEKGQASAAASHTPGPWLIGKGADGLPIVHTAPDSFSPSGQGVAHVCKRAMCQDHEANARLIAAAPDLLNALRWLTEAADKINRQAGQSFLMSCAEHAHDIIRQAEGRS